MNRNIGKWRVWKIDPHFLKIMNKKKTQGSPTGFVTRWLIAALTAISVACGAGDGVSSQSSPGESSTSNSQMTSKTSLQTPKFAQVNFSAAGIDGTKASNILLASQGSSGAVGGFYIPSAIWNSHRINVCWKTRTTGMHNSAGG